MEKLPEDNFTHNIHDHEQLNKPFKYLTASAIIGNKVNGEKDAHMDDIKDIMIYFTNGKLNITWLNFWAFLNMGRNVLPFR